MSDLVPAQPTPPPGWYVDATGQQRWWDGAAWGVYAPASAPPTQMLVRTAKDTGVAYLFAILLGGLGAHQFYLGHTGAGIGFLILWWGGFATTWLGVGFVMIFAAVVWWVIDLCLIPSYVRSANEKLRRS
jgi:TM2 domain-containing membrane protein YozV